MENDNNNKKEKVYIESLEIENRLNFKLTLDKLIYIYISIYIQLYSVKETNKQIPYKYTKTTRKRTMIKIK